MPDGAAAPLAAAHARDAHAGLCPSTLLGLFGGGDSGAGIGGDGGVGKSSLFKSIIGINDTEYKFQRNYQATPINEFNLVNLKKDKISLKLKQ